MEKIKIDVNEQENRTIQELENDSTKEKDYEVSEKKAAIHIDEGCLIAVIASDVKSE